MTRTTAQRAAWVAAAALLVFVLRLGLSGAASVGVGFAFVVPVGLATWWFGREIGLAVAVGCVALYVVAVIVDPVDQPVVSTVVRAALLVGVVMLVSALRERTATLAAAVEELDSLRLALTPPTLPDLPGLDAAVAFLPAEHGVSGDFYLVTNGSHGASIAVVGDVCGHGPEAAKLATFARATLASVAVNCDDPAEILDLVNRSLVERWEFGDYVTASCVVHDPVSRTIRWATAGHPAPIRLSDLSELPADSGAPLGIDARTSFLTQEWPLAPPDGVLLYTDGLLDARNGRDRYGETRMREALAGCATSPAAEVVRTLRRSVSSYAEERFPDDVCIVVLRAAASP